MNPSLKEIADLLKRLREQKHLSQRELADRVNMTQSHISNIESGAVNLGAISLFEITRALEHEIMLIPREEIQTVKAILAAKNRPESEWSSPAYTPDDEN